MAFKRKTRWDVQVYFPGMITRGLKSRSDVEQTPDSIIAALSEWLKDITAMNKRYKVRQRQIRRDPALRAEAKRQGIPL